MATIQKEYFPNVDATFSALQRLCHTLSLPPNHLAFERAGSALEIILKNGEIRDHFEAASATISSRTEGTEIFKKLTLDGNNPGIAWRQTKVNLTVDGYSNDAGKTWTCSITRKILQQGRGWKIAAGVPAALPDAPPEYGEALPMGFPRRNSSPCPIDRTQIVIPRLPRDFL